MVQFYYTTCGSIYRSDGDSKSSLQILYRVDAVPVIRMRQRGVILVQMVAVQFFLLWQGVISSDLPGYSVRLNNVNVQEGLCVTIPCNFTAAHRTTFTNSAGVWKDFFDKDLAFSDKSKTGLKTNFHFTGNPDNGDCTLTITNAGREDDGLYYFRFEESERSGNKYSYKNTPLQVNVTELKDRPRIILGKGKLIAGEETSLTCIFPVNCTGIPPTVQWMKSDHEGTWKSSASITFTPSKRDHQTNVTCNMTFWAGQNLISKTTTLELNVQYPPSVTITTPENKPVNRSVDVSGQKSVTLICRADSNPVADVTWYKEDRIMNKSKSEAAVQIDATGNTAYVCSAWNEVGMELIQVEVFLQGTSPRSQSCGTTIRDILIGAAGGFFVGLVIAVLLKFCSRKQPTLKPDRNPLQESPSSQDTPPDDELYAQIENPKYQVNVTEIPQESSDNEVNYASINFSKVVAKDIPREPETEYSEIKFQ